MVIFLIDIFITFSVLKRLSWGITSHNRRKHARKKRRIGIPYLCWWNHMNFITRIQCPYHTTIWLQVKVLLTSHLNFTFYDLITLTWLKTKFHIPFLQTLLSVRMKTLCNDSILNWQYSWQVLVFYMNLSCC